MVTCFASKVPLRLPGGLIAAHLCIRSGWWLTEESDRQKILNLLAEERQEQKDADDPLWSRTVNTKPPQVAAGLAAGVAEAELRRGNAVGRRELAAVCGHGALRFDPKVSYFVQACRSDCAYIGGG